MAHINHSRNVQRVGMLHIRNFFNNARRDNSFGIFGGTPQQRQRAALYAIGRCCSTRGVVLIHNDPSFEASLNAVYQLYPRIRQSNPGHQILLANSPGGRMPYYDPLYGLSENRVLDAICPAASDARTVRESNTLRSALSDYLSILETQFSIDPRGFGVYPYNLDMLLALTALPISSLDSSVLSHLPQSFCDPVYRRLSADGVQTSVFNAVRSFSVSVSQHLWSKRVNGSHTCLSLCQAVRTRNLISIYVPNSHPQTLEYLAIELEELNAGNVPYLLVTSGITMNQSPRFRQLFHNDHRSLNYSTGVLADTLFSCADTNDATETATALSQLDQTVVFACRDTQAAQPFCESIGHYDRIRTETHQETHRQPLHLFSSHGHGYAEHEERQLQINPEELVRIGAGGLLRYPDDPNPTLVSRIMLT